MYKPDTSDSRTGERKRNILTVISLIALAAFCLILLGLIASSDESDAVPADSFYYDDTEYVVTQETPNREVAIYLGADKETVVIPETVPHNGGTYTVTWILSNAWAEKQNVKYVTLPDTITMFGEKVFWGCTNLISVNIPSSAASFGDRTFQNCCNLRSVIIPEGVTCIEFNVFEGCTGLTSVHIPGSVTEIEQYAFYGCTGLTSVHIPGSVTAIGKYAFCGCTSLADVSFGEKESGEFFPSTAFNYPFKDKTGTYDVMAGIWGKSFTLYCGTYYSNDLTVGDRVTVGSMVFQVASTSPAAMMLIDGLGCSGYITIPETVKWGEVYSITSVGENAFYNNRNITGVTIPGSVRTVAAGAFAYSGMKTVSIGSGLVSVGSEAFFGCPLKSVEIPDSVTSIGNGAFGGCDLESASVPGSIRILADSAFADSRHLVSVTLGNGIEIIENRAFYGCVNLASVTIPDSVTTVCSSAFSGCTSLTSVTIPDSVEYIGDRAFSGCTSLTSVTIPDSVEHIGIGSFSGTGLELVCIPGSVTDMGSDAFKDIPTLTHISFGGKQSGRYGVDGSFDHPFVGKDGSSPIATEVWGEEFTLCDGKFAQCLRVGDRFTDDGIGYQVTSSWPDCRVTVFDGSGTTAAAVIPESVSLRDTYSVTSIEDGAFSCNTSIMIIGIPASAASIGADAFSGCTAVLYLVIPEGVTSIGANAFSGCTSMTEAMIPGSVTDIGRGAFSNCPSISAIAFGEKTSSLFDPSAAFDCPLTDKSGAVAVTTDAWGKSFTLNGDRYIMDAAVGDRFVDGGLEYRITAMSPAREVEVYRNVNCTGPVVIPSSAAYGKYAVTSIGSSAFYDSINITSVTIPDTVTSIKSGAFRGCTSVTSVSIPGSVTSLGANVFNRCTSLTSVTIPGSVTSIDDYTFCGCTSVTSVSIPDSVTALGEGIFDGCTSLTSAALPSGLTTLSSKMFRGCSSLTSAAIPDGVTEIGFSAFEGCASLASIAIPGGVTFIGASAFEECTSLTSVSIPGGVTYIGNDAFLGCSKIVSVTIPGDITTVSENAFSGCSSLIKVSFGKRAHNNLDPTSAFDSSFLGMDGTTVLTSNVWSKSFTYSSNAFRQDPAPTSGGIQWYIEDGVLIIVPADAPSSQFRSGEMRSYSQETAPWYTERSSITGIRLASGVIDIGNYAFYGLSRVTSVTGSDAVTSVGEHAFDGCTSLPFCSLTGCSTVKAYAFSGCGLMSQIVLGPALAALGDHAFSGCTGLMRITIEDNQKFCTDGYALYAQEDGVMTELILFAAKNGAVSYTVPETATAIRERAFEGSADLRTVTLIGSDVKTGGPDMFWGCNNLGMIIVRSDLINAYKAADNWSEYSSKFAKYTGGVSGGIEWHVEDYALYVSAASSPEDGYASGVMKDYTKDGAPWYLEKDNIYALQIDGVVKIGDYAFYNLANVGMHVPDRHDDLRPAPERRGDRAIQLGVLPLPGVAIVGAHAFEGCDNLLGLQFDSSLVIVKEYAFSGCTRLNYIELGVVRTIGDFALSGTAITKIGLSEFLESLGEGVFAGCSKLNKISILGNSNYRIGPDNMTLCNGDLTEIICYPAGLNRTSYTVPDRVTAISSYAFDSCANLKSIRLNSALQTIGEYAFRDCSGLTSVAIPDSVTAVSGHAFDGCTGLTSVDMCGTLLTINEYAFRDCRALTSVTIPVSVTSVGTGAFLGCTSLLKVYVCGSTVKTGGTDMFRNCIGLSEIYVGSGLAGTYRTAAGWSEFSSEIAEFSGSGVSGGIYWYMTGGTLVIRSAAEAENGYERGVMIDYQSAEAVPWHQYRASVTSLLIDSDVKNIGSFAFAGITGISSVPIGTNITGIGAHAFDGCTGLTDIYLSSVATVGDCAFAGCTGLTDVKLTNVTAVGDYAFSGCTSLTCVELGAKAVSVGDRAFYGCTALIEFKVNSGNTSYKSDGSGVLYRITGDGRYDLVKYPAGRTDATYSTIEGTVNIKEYAFEDGVHLTTVEIEHAAAIEAYAFRGCTGLETIRINCAVGSIDTDAFSGCVCLRQFVTKDLENLSYIAVGGVLFTSVGGMPDELVKYPAGRTDDTYDIPDGVKKVRTNAFYGNLNLKGISIPKSVTEIQEYAFAGCFGLEFFDVSSQNAAYASSGGVLFSKDMKTLVQYPANRSVENYKVPATVTAIKAHSFEGASSLRGVTLPDGLISVGDYAFSACIALRSVEIPRTVSSIGECAFSGCRALESVTVEALVTVTGGTDMFLSCDSLSELLVPGTLVQSYLSAPNWQQYGDIIGGYSDGVSGGIYWWIMHEVLTVEPADTPEQGYAAGAMKNYRAGDAPWYQHRASIISITISDGVTTVGDWAFAGLSAANSVSFPDTMTLISSHSFAGCSGLRSLEIKTGVTLIGDYAFDGCTGLLYVSLPEGLLTLGDYAMKGCTGLIVVGLPATLEALGEDPFNGCGSIAAFAVGNGSEHFSAVSGVLFSKDGSDLLRYPANMYGSTYSIPDTARIIYPYAFSGCARLVTVVIPGEVNTIGDNAFEGCSALKGVLTRNTSVMQGSEGMFPSSVQCISVPQEAVEEYRSAEYWSEYASKITGQASGISGGIEWIVEYGVLTISPADDCEVGYAKGDMKNYMSQQEVPWYTLAEGITAVTLDSGICAIGQYALSGLSIDSVTIPESVTRIGSNAFRGCTNLESVLLPRNIQDVGPQAFRGCSALKVIGVDNDNSNFASFDGVLFSKSGDTLIMYPAGREGTSYEIVSTGRIMDYAFCECTGLTSITLPETLTEIAEGAFYGCTGLTSLTIPRYVDTIGWNAFGGCTSLSSFSVYEGNSRFYAIDGVLFDSGDDLVAYPAARAGTSYAVPDGTYKIRIYAFYENTNLVSVTMPDTMVFIENYAFYGCTGLESVTISGDTVGDYAFYGCTSLTEITFLDSSQDISFGNNAFDYGFVDAKYDSIDTGSESVSKIRGFEFVRIDRNGTMFAQKVKLDLIAENGSFVYKGYGWNPMVVGNPLTKNNWDDLKLSGCTIETEYSDNVNAGTATITVRVSSHATLSQAAVANVQFTILPKEVELEWIAPDLVYDGTAKVPAAIAKALCGSDVCTVISSVTVAGTNVNAGDFTFTATGLSNANYVLGGECVSGVYTIVPKTITVLNGGTAISKTYDGTAAGPAITKGIHYVFEGVAAGDEVDFVSSASIFNDENVNSAVSVTISSLSLNNGNYVVSSAVLNASVAKADYSDEGYRFSDRKVVYNGEVQTPSVIGELPVGADGIQLTASYSEGLKDVGYRNVTATFATESPNYNVPSPITAKLTVAPKEIAVANGTAQISKIYDGTAAGITLEKGVHYVFDGIIGSDSVDFVSAACAFNSADVADASSVAIASLALNNANYRISSAVLDASIAKAEYALGGFSFTSAEKTYNGQTQCIEVTGVLPTGADGIQVAVDYSAGRMNAGYTTMTATFSTASGNYNAPAPMIAILTIAPKEITVANGTAQISKTYDGSVAYRELTKGTDYAFIGIIGSDDVDFTDSTGVFNDANVNVARNVTIPNLDLTNDNYSVTAAVLDASISKADYRMAGISFDDAEYTYDAQSHGIEVTGTLPTGEDGIQLTVAYSEGMTDVGNKNITATFSTSSGNYNVPAPATAVLTIVPRSIGDATVTLNGDSFIYDGNDKTVQVLSVKCSDLNVTTYDVSGDMTGTEIGTYTVTVTARGNFTGTCTKTWSIAAGSSTIYFDVLGPEYGSLDAEKIDNVPGLSVITVDGNRLTVNGVTVTASVKTAPTGEIYTFAGWSVESGTQVVMDTHIAATFEKSMVQITLTFMNCGREYSKSTVDYGTAVVLPADPSKPSTETVQYRFASWIGYTAGMKALKDTVFEASYDSVIADVDISGGKVVVGDDDSESAVLEDAAIEKMRTAASQGKSVTIELNRGSITLDPASMSSVASGEQTVSLRTADISSMPDDVKKKIGDKPVYDVRIGDTHEFGGKITVSLEYELRSGEKAEGLCIWYLKEDGSYQKMNCSYADGKVTFTTDHLSVYAVMYEDPVSVDVPVLIGCAFIVVLAVAIVFLGHMPRKE